MKVILGMSGGVDSTISAYILKKNGYDVIGVYLDFLNDEKDDNLSKINILKKLGCLSEKLDIKILYRNYKKEFYNTVIKDFVENYEKGFTPNPCAYCNGVMKFKKLEEIKDELEFDKIATGHYAGIEKIKDRFVIRKSENEKKDQSYMLWSLSQEILKDVIFPIGDMDKQKIREIATELNLEVANEKDSEDICFVKDIDYKEFIKRYEFGDDYLEKIASGKLKENEIFKKVCFKKGEFIDKDRKVLGYHNGIINYTIGQRKGLNIALGERKFVVDIDVDKNQVMLGDDNDLYNDEFIVDDINMQGAFDIDEIISKDINMDLYVKVRYRHEPTLCKLYKKSNDNIICKTSEKIRAITKGQSAVFYDKFDRIIFAGVIRVS